MAPKKAKAPPPPTADPNALLYLHALGKAAVHVERVLDTQVHEFQDETVRSLESAGLAQRELAEQITHFKSERERLANEEGAGTARISFLEQQIREEDDAFADKMKTLKSGHEEKMDALQKQIDHLQAQSDAAAAWRRVRLEKIADLSQLHTKIDQLTVSQTNEMNALTTSHEEEKRKLRDVLVRKLRRIRDLMTADAEEDDDAVGGSVGAAFAGDAAAPARLTERLSREVTTYEREMKSAEALIREHEAQLAATTAHLTSQRESNERLVFRNASHAQSLKLLAKRTEELKEAETSTKAKKRAVAGDQAHVLTTALVAEKHLRSDLEQEISLAAEQLEAAKRDRVEAQRALLAQVERDLNAAEYIDMLVQLWDTSSPGNIRHSVITEHEPVPIHALGLADSPAIVRLLSAASNALVEEIPHEILQLRD